MNNGTIAVALSMMGMGFALVACSAPEPGVLTERSQSPSASGGGTAPTPSGTYGGASGGGDAGGRWDSGAGSASDAAAGDASAVNTFLGDPSPYASKPPAVSARARHAAVGQAAQQPSSDCLTCHGANGLGVQFIAAGFIATQPNGTNGASDVEVRVWSKTSQTGASGHTDADGFFWIKPPADAVAAPFQAGVRTATTQKIMPVQAPGGACNGTSCHGGGQGAVHVP